MEKKPNQFNIQPLTTWVRGESKTMTLVSFDRLAGYHFDGNGARVDYTLYDTDMNMVTGGFIAIPADIVASWTDDDNVLFDYVLTQLNLIKA